MKQIKPIGVKLVVVVSLLIVLLAGCVVYDHREHRGWHDREGDEWRHHEAEEHEHRY